MSFHQSFKDKKRRGPTKSNRVCVYYFYKELKLIGKTLNIPDEEVYSMWENRVKQVLESAGMNIYSNSELINSMFDCAKKYLMKG